MLNETDAVRRARACLAAHHVRVAQLSAIRFDSAEKLAELARKFPGVPLETRPRWIVTFDQKLGDPEAAQDDFAIVTTPGVVVEVDAETGRATLATSAR